jgi:uncharacterized protein (UPF0332 family)
MINADDLLSHADALLVSKGKGAPSQVNLRRAVSAAYYALFHRLLADSADRLVGRTKCNEATYALVYRAFEHSKMRQRAEQAINPNSKIYKNLPRFGLADFSDHVRKGATAFVDLQIERHKADYDPRHKLTLETAKAQVGAARTAIANFSRASESEYALFLLILLFDPRD